MKLFHEWTWKGAGRRFWNAGLSVFAEVRKGKLRELLIKFTARF